MPLFGKKRNWQTIDPEERAICEKILIGSNLGYLKGDAREEKIQEYNRNLTNLIMNDLALALKNTNPQASRELERKHISEITPQLLQFIQSNIGEKLYKETFHGAFRKYYKTQTGKEYRQ